MFKNKRRGPIPFKYVFLITFVAFNILTAYSLWMINEIIEPALISIAETKTRQIAAQAINDSISKRISENVDINELIVIHENSSNEPIGYSFNPKVYNRLISEATIRVQQYLDYIESGELDKLQSFKNDIDIDFDESKSTNGVIYTIPLGMATSNTLLSNLGPHVPVRFEIIGDVTSEIKTSIKESGINNTYLEVYMDIKVRMNVIIPSLSTATEISNAVKIGDLFLPGTVPEFYNGNGGNGFNPAIIPPNN